MPLHPQEKARIVAEYLLNQPVTRTQSLVPMQMRKEPPARNTSYNGTLNSWKAEIFLIEGAIEDPVQVNKQ